MPSIWDARYVVVDVETTGSDPLRNAIIEIACILVQNSTILDEFSSLVNPHQYIPKVISSMTGITNEMVATAPEFKELIPELDRFFNFEGTIFVAHNVNFDYDFVRCAFEKNRKTFGELPRLCTLRLARRLLTSQNKKNVGSLASFFGIPIKHRHRAYDDARATASILLELLEIADNEYNISNTEELLIFQNKKLYAFSLSKVLSHNIIFAEQNVPNSPGVYFFLDKYSKPLYIGKANSLRRRLSTYFAPSVNSRKILSLLKSTSSVKWEETKTELSALIRESFLIKNTQPPFNKLSKRWRNLPFIKINTNLDYPTFEISYEVNLKEGEYFGPFKNRTIADIILEIIHKKFRLKKCPDSDAFARPSERCIYFQMNKCLAPCIGESKILEYIEEINKVKEFLFNFNDGLIFYLKEKMHSLSAELKFEEAGEVRQLINEIEKPLETNKNGFNSSLKKNFVAIVYQLNNDENRFEILFIKNGLLAKEYAFTNKIDFDELKSAIFKTYFEPEIAFETFSLENIEEMRIIDTWIYNNRNRIEIIPIENQNIDLIIKHLREFYTNHKAYDG